MQLVGDLIRRAMDGQNHDATEGIEGEDASHP